jgi:DNA-binding response OmpR family regulator
MVLPAPDSESSQPIAEGPLQGRRVLLVDDDALLLRAWARTLAQHGMLVTAAMRIHEAREELVFLRKRGLHFALVDDRLPDGFGLDLVPALAELRPKPAFAVVSAHPSTERALRAWQSQTVIVPKPVSPTGLLQLMGFLAEHRSPKRRERPKREQRVETLPFGAFVLDPDGLSTPDGFIKLSATAVELLAQLVERGGAWVRSVELARELYGRDDPHTMMVVRRHISLLRRALGKHRWLVESEIQRGYRIAGAAFQPRLQ